jgi:FkbM family methyltransferase
MTANGNDTIAPRRAPTPSGTPCLSARRLEKIRHFTLGLVLQISVVKITGKISSIIALLRIVQNRGGLVRLILGKNVSLRLLGGLNLHVDYQDRWAITELATHVARIRRDGLEILFEPTRISTRPYADVSVPLQGYSPIQLANLVALISYGIRFGFLVTNDWKPPIADFVTISEELVAMPDGSKFHLDKIDPYIIVETFFLRIHDIPDLRGKVVVDVGAAFGDTPIYFARQGATVYAVEPVNHAFLVSNLALNPEIKDRITPVNLAIGTVGTLKMMVDPRAVDGGASAYTSRGGTYLEVSSTTVYDLVQALNIGHIDVLKLDCKGCEFRISTNDLDCVQERILIEFNSDHPEDVERLYSLLRYAGFTFTVTRYGFNPEHLDSLKCAGHIVGWRPDAVGSKMPSQP